MLGQVVKIFSDFFYVNTQNGIVEAKLRSVLKKQKEAVYTGDIVELEQYNENSKQAFIKGIKDRISLINRPKVANVTQVIVVSALKEPDINYEQLDRYIAQCEYHNIQPILCFNKEDIENTDRFKEEICKIYGDLKYKIIFTSALQKTGIEELKPILKDNTTILCGSSGVGKSSIINAILNTAYFKTTPVSSKTKKGVHTTRHCELIEIEKNSFIVDTPGFSQLKFDFLLPSEMKNLFIEFKEEKNSCYFKNCLHIGEKGCSYDKIIKLMSKSRYESYKKFVSEAQEYEAKISKCSVKKEASTKFNKNKIMTKISNKKRIISRKTAKQKINTEEE